MPPNVLALSTPMTAAVPQLNQAEQAVAAIGSITLSYATPVPPMLVPVPVPQATATAR